MWRISCETVIAEDTPHVDDRVGAVPGSSVRLDALPEGTTAMVTASHVSETLTISSRRG
jgi:hypothetical protein